MRSQIMPEVCYDFKNLTMEELKIAHLTHKTIVGQVGEINKKDQSVKVLLGTDIYGLLPFNEVSIFELSFAKSGSQDLPVQIASIIGTTIRVKVTYIDDETIMLSRRENMIESLSEIEHCRSVFLHIKSIFPNKLFGDIGDGLPAMLLSKDASQARIRSLSELFHKGDKVWVNVLECKDGKFLVSYRDTFPKYSPDNFKIGDCYKGVVKEPVNEKRDGYFVSITPQITGIMDVTSSGPLLYYGKEVNCKVKEANAKGLKFAYVPNI